jgi:hypothetical protein
LLFRINVKVSDTKLDLNVTDLFFYMIKKIGCTLILLCLMSCYVNSQIRLDKLELSKRQVYTIEESDILVVDTLIMRDSSKIVLNYLKQDNIITAKVLVVGIGCSIIGSGGNGPNGKTGVAGSSTTAPCTVGEDARNGYSGLPGANGLNLSLYIEKVVFDGSITINLNGGDGGNGGTGGRGGTGGAATKFCSSADGGKAGNGGNGANGGKGGNLTIKCAECPELYLIQDDRLLIRAYGGFAGEAGNGGKGGPRGSGKGNSKNGLNGTPGLKGKEGKRGTVVYSRKL